MTPRTLLLLASLLLLAPRPATAAREPDASASAEVLARATPSVLLVVVERPSGEAGYGAGVLVGKDGLALTNLHVVADAVSLKVMFYDPARMTYAPMDGGLPRTLFEAERDLRPARLVRGDPGMDLAVIQVEGVSGPLDPLPARRSEVVPGERVYALGHPQESVWTFTAGVVSAIRQGVIQHDAPISPGSSGGPLIDARGRLIGINTSRLNGAAEGIAFARPVALGLALFDAAAAPVKLDLSAPDRATLSCNHATELQPEAADPCFYWPDGREMGTRAGERAAELLDLDQRQRAALRAALREQAETVEARIHGSVSAHQAGRPQPMVSLWELPLPFLWENTEEQEAHFHRVRDALVADLLERKTVREGRAEVLLQKNGLKVDLTRDTEAYQQTRKLGLRADAVFYVSPEHAWVVVAGRNLDGSPYRDSECWSRFESGWRQRLFCTDAHHAGLPAEWPPPAWDDREVIRRLGLSLALKLLGRTTADLEVTADKEASTP